MHRSRPGDRRRGFAARLLSLRITRWVASFLASLVSSSIALAGAIEPALQADFDSASPDELHSAIFGLADAVDTDALVRSLTSLRFSRSAQHSVVIDELRTTAQASQAEFLQEVRVLQASGEVTGFTPFWITNAIVVEGTRRALERLAQHRSVIRAEKNRAPVLIEPLDVRVVSQSRTRGSASDSARELAEAPTATPGIAAIEVPRVWNELHLNGEGTIVAIIDTGVDGAHPALSARWRGHRADPEAAWFNVVDEESTFPSDVHGHGTHVMGTMAGLDLSTGDSIGIAYGAEWIAANAVSPRLPRTRFSNAVMAAFQWLADPDGDPTTSDDVPDVVQNSWGVTPSDGFEVCESIWWNAIDACEAAGVVVTFSAGNSGPISYSLISPADRATTPFKNFSVGAIQATNEEWPYPIATFSSRGPTSCPPRLAIKPEVVAPGVEVYSAWTGSGRYAYASGTSMAGPHVAGVVALMRQANPDLPVDEVKRILMETARPYGPEDNDYGAGLVDAYAAVLAARAEDGSGRLDGSISGPGNEPVPHAEVRVIETGQSFLTGSNGRFLGFVPQGTYTVEIRHPLLEMQTRASIEVTPDVPTDLSIQLFDRTGPLVQDLEVSRSLVTLDEPVRIRLRLAEYGMVLRADLHVRRVATWARFPLVPRLEGEGIYEGSWDVSAFGDSVAFFIEAADEKGNVSLYPAGGADEPQVVRVERRVFWDDAENDLGWSFASAGDTGYGRWVRTDPYGTQSFGRPVEPGNDHTDAGASCFVTGKGRGDHVPENSDVDAGCVTLTSPLFDLEESGEMILEFWRWFALDGGAPDGSLRVEATSDSGTTWVLLEEVATPTPEWRKVSIALGEKIDPGRNVRVRFIACDRSTDSFVEAAIDDFELRALPRPQPIEPVPAPVRLVVFPNPMRDLVTLVAPAPSGSAMRVEILDPAGRRLRELEGQADGHDRATVIWDGRDARGAMVPPGVVFYRIDAAGQKRSGKVLILR